MEGRKTDLPREEYIEFDTPILSEPRDGSTLLGQLYAGDRVTVTSFHNGYAKIGIGRRAAYVRQDAVGIPLPSSAPSTAVPRNTSSSLAMPNRKPPNRMVIHPAHPGALLVATGLTVFAWITLVLSQVSGMLAAANYSCTDSFAGTTCDNESLLKLVAFLVLAIPGSFMALLMWAAAYGLLLLATIEGNTRVLWIENE